MFHRSAGPALFRPARWVTAGAALLAAAGTVLLAFAGMPAAASTNHAPIGHLDAVRAEPGGIRVIGWAADPDAPHTSVDLMVRLGPAAGEGNFAWIAHDPRPDVAKVYPALGQYHGINLFYATKPATFPVCVSALDSTGGPATSLGCVQVSVPAEHSAIGHLDAVRSVGNNHITVTGWGADQDTPDRAVSINVLLGSSVGWKAFNAVRLGADQPRPDLVGSYPALGPNHGFSLTVAARPGTYPVCAWAFDTYINGGSTLLGCSSVTV
jgi:hypothetical protein